MPTNPFTGWGVPANYVPVPFVPSDLSNLKVWWDVSTSTVAQNTPVLYSDLINRSPATSGSYNCTNSGKSLGLFSYYQNGLRTMQLPVYQNCYISEDQYLTDFTVFYIGKNVSTPHVVLASNVYATMNVQAPSGYMAFSNDAGAQIDGSTVSADSTHCCYVFRRSGNTVNFYRNGSGMGSGTTSGGEINFNKLFGYDYLHGGYSTGAFAELLIYDRALDSTEQGNVTEYARAKWGLY